MAFTAVSMARNLSQLGQKTEQYEADYRLTMESLNKIRAEATIDYEKEVQLIQFLEEIEDEKDISTGKTALELGNKTVKLCAGPTVGIVSSIFTSVVKKQSSGSEDLASNVSDSLLEAGINQVQKEATKELYSMATDWLAECAADWLGIAAGTAAIAMAPVAVGATVLVGGAACALSPSIRATCSDYISETAKGAGALFSQAVSDGKSRSLIQSHRLWHHKWTRLKRREKTFNKIAAELQSLKDGHIQNQDGLTRITSQIKAFENASFYHRFVSWVNDKSPLFQTITRLFSSLSESFKKSVSEQNKLKSEKRHFKISINNQEKLILHVTKAVDQLAEKIQLKKSIVDNLEKAYSSHLKTHS